MTAYPDLPGLFRRAADLIDAVAARAEAADPTGDRWDPDKVYDESFNVWPLYLMDGDKPIWRANRWSYPEDASSGGVRVNADFAVHIAVWDPPPARIVARLLRLMADYVEHIPTPDLPSATIVAEFVHLAREIVRGETGTPERVAVGKQEALRAAHKTAVAESNELRRQATHPHAGRDAWDRYGDARGFARGLAKAIEMLSKSGEGSR